MWHCKTLFGQLLNELQNLLQQKLLNVVLQDPIWTVTGKRTSNKTYLNTFWSSSTGAIHDHIRSSTRGMSPSIKVICQAMYNLRRQ